MTLLKDFGRVQVHNGDRPFVIASPSNALAYEDARRLRRDLCEALDWYDWEITVEQVREER